MMKIVIIRVIIEKKVINIVLKIEMRQYFFTNDSLIMGRKE